ncbi:hypothetical protein BKM63_14895 [Flavobacterium johnsoniae]|uniref:Uncharacterized protein n=1 Tax=Flavobacterium johnsoniae TaxID=986 RepID=A0A1J7C5N3_FLAJO|nr:hypothetical protein BKM63_14895 [Flavobacterium johnsoniae]
MEVGFFKFFFKNNGQGENQAAYFCCLIFDFIKLCVFNVFQNKNNPNFDIIYSQLQPALF